jgi:hypothetical protein
MKLQIRMLITLILLAWGVVPVTAQAAPRLANVSVTTWLSTKTPAQNSNVYAFVWVNADKKARAKIAVTFTWNFASGVITCTAKTDSRGIAWCRQNIGTAPYGTPVTVQASLSVDGQKYSTKTAFTPTQLSDATPTVVPTPSKRAGPQ